MSIHNNIKPDESFGNLYLSPTLEKDGKTYIRIGVNENARELYQRVEFNKEYGYHVRTEEIIGIKKIKP